MIGAGPQRSVATADWAPFTAVADVIDQENSATENVQTNVLVRP
jgi:hypothetical protein